MKKERTKEEKAKYYKELRERWTENKKLADDDKDAKKRYEGLNREVLKIGKFSYYSFYFTLQSMRRQKLEGTPYVDCKTFNGWHDAGFKVKKGEKSVIDGITWFSVYRKGANKDKKKEDEDDDSFLVPKLYHLFHRSQVEEIK